MTTVHSILQKDRQQIDPILQCFLAKRLWQATGVPDGIQLVFETKHVVNIYAPLSLALARAQVGKSLSAISLDHLYLTMDFSGASLRVPLTQSSPEAAQIFSPEGELVLRADGAYLIGR